MLKIKKLLSIGLTCFIIMSSVSFVACGGRYNCATCEDRGIIDCPSCHVMRCSENFCQNGKIPTKCTYCDGKGYTIGLCPICDGDGYDDALRKCVVCKGNRVERIDCDRCIAGYYESREDCSFCEDGYIGGKKCSDPSCTVPSNIFENDGYTYIDCPDCER